MLHGLRLICTDWQDIWWRVHWDDPYNYICYVLHDHHVRHLQSVPNLPQTLNPKPLNPKPELWIQATGKGYAGLLVAFNAGHEAPHSKPTVFKESDVRQVRSCDLPADKPWYRPLTAHLMHT